MIYLQVLANGVVLGGLYAAIAVGFGWSGARSTSLICCTADSSFSALISLSSLTACLASIDFWQRRWLVGSCLRSRSFALQGTVINRVIRAPVLMTLTLTFGLDLLLNNAMLLAFKADYRKVVLDPPLGSMLSAQSCCRSIGLL